MELLEQLQLLNLLIGIGFKSVTHTLLIFGFLQLLSNLVASLFSLDLPLELDLFIEHSEQTTLGVHLFLKFKLMEELQLISFDLEFTNTVHPAI